VIFFLYIYIFQTRENGIVANKNLLAFPDGSHTHTSTNAHGSATNLLALSLQLRKQSGDLTGTSASERVTKGNSTTLGVDLLEGDVELLSAVDGLGGEGFVEFDNVNVGDLNTSAFSGDGDGIGRSDAHDTGRNTSNSGSNVLAKDGQVELLGSLALHEQNSGSTIRNLGGVTSSGETIVVESRLELSE
jgi:hypothetical protein